MKLLSKFNPRLILTNAITSLLSRLQTKKADLADVYFCYRLLLGRRAENEGWRHWSQKVTSGMTSGQLAQAFLCSHEFRRKHMLREPIRIDVDDFVIYADPNDFSSQSILAAKTYEPHVTATLKRILKANHTFLDIGCNIGWFVLLAASIAKNGKVIGVEPNYNNVQMLYRSLIENGFENVIVFPYAATDRRTMLQLSADYAYGFVHSPDESADSYVQGVAIDELLKDVPTINVIKIDIEGHEPIALQGMRDTIHRHKPLIISEFHPECLKKLDCEPKEYLDMLVRLGYRLSVIEPDGNELELGETPEIMNYWHTLNQKYNTGDSMHLDILARPV